MPSKRYETAMALIDDFDTLDVPTMLSRRTSDCLHIFAPACIAPPPKNNAAFGEHITRLKEVMPKFTVHAKEVMEDERQNVVIVYATSEAHFHERLKDQGIPAAEWEYHGTYVFFLTMNETGDKVKRVLEFLDSKGTERLRELIKRARENLQAN